MIDLKDLIIESESDENNVIHKLIKRLFIIGNY